MSIIRTLQLVKKLHDLICKKATGNREQFAQKMKMSESSLNKYLREIKILGFPVAYDKTKETYHYKDKTDLSALLIQLDDKKLNREKQTKNSHLYNGKNNYN